MSEDNYKKLRKGVNVGLSTGRFRGEILRVNYQGPGDIDTGRE